MADTTFTSVLSDVSETIKAEAGDAVLARVKETFVERELARRTDALVKAFDKLTEAKSALGKIKADVVAYDDEGEVASTNWSKAKLEERNKARKAVTKVEEAINAALAGDFNKVYNM